MSFETNDLRFAGAGFPLMLQGEKGRGVYAYTMQIADRFILITEEDYGYCVGLHSAVDCITYTEISAIGADTVGTTIWFAQCLAIACYVRALTRAMSN